MCTAISGFACKHSPAKWCIWKEKTSVFQRLWLCPRHVPHTKFQPKFTIVKAGDIFKNKTRRNEATMRMASAWIITMHDHDHEHSQQIRLSNERNEYFVDIDYHKFIKSAASRQWAAYVCDGLLNAIHKKPSLHFYQQTCEKKSQQSEIKEQYKIRMFSFDFNMHDDTLFILLCTGINLPTTNHLGYNHTPKPVCNKYK